MAQSRQSFLDFLANQGFKKYRPKGDIYKYLEREHFKMAPFAIGISPKGNSIAISVHDLERKITNRFAKYSDATDFVKEMQAAISKGVPPPPTPKAKKRHRKGVSL